VAAPVVVLSRAIRDAEAETVPSRWLNRLSNLLDGLGPEGRAALAGMRGRGAALLAQAARLERPGAPVAAAPRPSPRPPLKARPGRLAVTSITRLIRDPYAIYARHVLHLRRLAPLRPEPDARLRGTVLHRIMDDFVDAWPEWHGEREAGRTVLARIARARLAEATPGAAMRALWLARLMAAADRLIEGEAARRAVGAPVLSEDWGEASVADLPFRLSARPDRIDRLIEGGHAIHDYKSGTPPSLKQVRLFDKQLPLEAALLERGGFPGLAAGPVAAMSYIALGANGKDVPIPVEEEDGRMPDLAWQGLIALLCRYGRREQGYTAQRAAEKVSFAGDYDHLARFGEWQLTDPPVGETVGPPDEDGEPGP